MRITFTISGNHYLKKYIIYLLHFYKTQNNRKKGNNIGRLLVVEFEKNEIHLFDKIMEVFRKYPDFQKYEVNYAPTISFPNLKILPDQRKVYCGKREVSLTTKEFNLLYYFAANEEGFLHTNRFIRRYGAIMCRI